MPKEDKNEEKKDRREFMKRVAAVTAATAAVGVGTNARGQTARVARATRVGGPRMPRVAALAPDKIAGLKGSQKAFAETLSQALTTLDVQGAIRSKGQGLVARDKQLLSQLDQRDLADLNFILQKVPAGGAVASNIGTIVF